MFHPRPSAPKPGGGLQSLGPSALGVAGLTLLLLPFSIHSAYTQWDRSLLRSPVCRPPPPQPKGLPKLIVLLGTEGGGHDLFESIFESLPTKLTIERFDPSVHLTSGPIQRTSPADFGLPHKLWCPKLPYARRTDDLGVQISAALKAKAPSPSSVYVRVRDPFPMGRIRTPLARPDPVSLAAFHGLHYDLKAVVLVRNLSRAVMWSVSRNFHNADVGLQLRLLEDSLTFLDASLRTLPCGTYAIVDVDAVEADPAAAAGQLASFLGLAGVGRTEVTVAMQIALSRGFASTSGQPEPTFGGQKIESFFNQRKGLWPLLTAAKSTPIFIPGRPTSWPGRLF